MIEQNIVDELRDVAIRARENAQLIGPTAVGAAILSIGRGVFSGCNIEHPFRCHDIHAEVCAISNMVAHGCYKFDYMMIVADVERFTPCGSCMDWIMRFGGGDCVVMFLPLNSRDPIPYAWKACELMPHYPRR